MGPTGSKKLPKLVGYKLIQMTDHKMGSFVMEQENNLQRGGFGSTIRAVSKQVIKKYIYILYVDIGFDVHYQMRGGSCLDVFY